MGNCTTAPLEHDSPLLQSNDTMTSSTNAADNAFLSDPGRLPIPQSLESLLPPQNAHKNVRDRFEWHEEIGHGVTGSVHAVTYQHRECALKTVDRSNTWTEAMFITEAQTLCNLQHRGIIGVVDLFLDEDHFYLAMQRADCDLKQLMTSSGPLDEDQTKRVIYALFDAVAYLHSQNVVHRDLKPQNIVFSNNDLTAPRLIDFGDCEKVEDEASYTEFVGTPPYMAPERLGEHKGWQLKKADVWAIGAIAYEMLVGKRCFEGSNQREVFAKICRGQWAFPQECQLSPSIQDLIRQCLSMDAKQRPSASAVLDHPCFADLSDCKSDGPHDDVQSVESMLHKLVSMVETNPLQDLLVKAYSERLTQDEMEEFKLEFNRLDADRDGLITQNDLVAAVQLDAAMATKMIVHLNKGLKDATHISFDRFVESRMKHDLSRNAQSVFHEILGGAKSICSNRSYSNLSSGSALLGFESCETASTRSLTPSPITNDHEIAEHHPDRHGLHLTPTGSACSTSASPHPAGSECLSQAVVIEFAVSQFPFKIEVCDSTLDKVFHRFGATEGLLSSKEFGDSMKVRPIPDALGLESLQSLQSLQSLEE